ncbi:hypothetical protein [Pedobacter gandavensis]|uniref:hypothetical protein n=1 Tax=Pedobacter gandavensis TaxID=2679963 RepID=UPI00292F2F4F|nr:hypothetical protein [Pedobacter gandavensis]
MSWEREPLFLKSKLFFEKAFEEDKTSPFFGLWCAMGLELLIRSAVAKISPMLLADPDPTHQNLLHALNYGSATSKKKSLITIHVLGLCKTLIPDFTDDQSKIASSIINQRNEELHSGTAAFEAYPTSQWIGGFYKCCKILSEFQGESLTSLFGEEVEEEATVILTELQQEVVSKTKGLIAAYKKVFEEKTPEEQRSLKEEAEKNSEKLAYRGHHRVECPSCGSLATVYGEPFGKENVHIGDGEITTKQSILPTKFHCIACDLKLNGYSALNSANLASHYTRRITISPEEYFDMIDPDDQDAISAKFREFQGYDEYNND